MKFIIYLLLLLFFGVALWKGIPFVYDFCNRTKYYNCYISKARIVSKRYQEAFTSHYKNKLHYNPEEFNIIVDHEGRKYIINDEKTYKSFDVDDEIYVQVWEAYNPKGEKKYTIVKV